MNWSEGTWEDILDPPSSFRLETLDIEDNNSHQTIQDRSHQHAPLSRKQLTQHQRGSNSSFSSSSKKEPCDETLVQDLLESRGDNVSRNDKNQAVPQRNGVRSANKTKHSDEQRSKCLTDEDVKSSKRKSFKNSNMNLKLNSKSENVTSHGNCNIESSLKQYDAIEMKRSGTDASPVPLQSLNDNQNLGSVQQNEDLRTILTAEESRSLEQAVSASMNGGNYSKLSRGNGTSKRDYTLHEYEKIKMNSRKYLQDRRSIHPQSYYAALYADENVENIHEEEDRVNSIICMVFCVMSFGVVFGLIFIVIHFSEDKEQKERKEFEKHNSYSEFMNNIYHTRIAAIIKSAYIMDQEWLHPDKKSAADSRQDVKSQSRCEMESPYLLGNATDIDLNITVDYHDIISNNSDVRDGGEWTPSSCVSRQKVAIIIPYRDRWNHLKILLYYLIPLLKRQQIHFRVFIVEQFGNETFNKGRIMNAAFREALKLFDFHCVSFHDVDLVPEDDRNMYTCADQPKHMSIGIDKFDYKLPYEGLVGGVLMFQTDKFQLANGYSNMYWGWGAEDDDMTARIRHNGMRIYRPPSNIARYKMIKHHGRQSSEVAVRMKLLRSAARRGKLEGLNNVQYKLVTAHIERLFTHFIVDIGHP